MSADYAEVNETQRARLFHLLSDGGWHLHSALAKVAGVRYGARVRELRRQGYVVETADIAGEQGKVYRMPSTDMGAAAPKRVKVLLEETDVLSMLRGYVPPSAQKALADAHGSLDTNREKL